MQRITYGEIRKQLSGKPFTMSLVGHEAKLVQQAVNQGIDARLEACCFEGQDTYQAHGNRLNCEVSPQSFPVLLRRLSEMYATDEDEDNREADGNAFGADMLDVLFNDEERNEHRYFDADNYEVVPPNEYTDEERQLYGDK